MTLIWFCLLVFMLGGYVVLGGTDLGVGMLSLLIARNEEERSQVIHAIRPAWKPNEVWLLAAGGTMFLAFPTALAASFSGFYLALTIVVWLLAFRGLGLELRHHINDPLWRQFWDVALSLSSFLLALFFGTALGNVVRGVPLDGQGIFFEPLWTNFRVGQQTGILDWYTVLAGLTAVFALAHHGTCWLEARTNGPVCQRAARLAIPFCITTFVLLLFLDLASFAARLQFRDALRARPWGLLFPTLTLAGLAASLIWGSHRKRGLAYLSSCVALFAALATAAVGIFPNILPARDPNFALSIYDSTVSPHNLAVALWWWIPGVLLVIGYFAFIHTNTGNQTTDQDKASISGATARSKDDRASTTIAHG
ncbi:MAG: cytochrome d ubiquinol oxidase subunit II [Verrucomicrobia bacterium]|nr:MAG: cytochrome d ubiquinol oxidase subunit II [Verrucomicrobiota bacterium]